MTLKKLENTLQAREAALFAIYRSMAGEAYASDTLNDWAKRTQPDERERRLAWELANGTIRRQRTLNYLAKRATPTGRLQLKQGQRALLYMTLYQLRYMDRIPAHAAVNEAIQIAKKLFPHPFASFLNAVLRKASEDPAELPEDLGVRLSYPDWLVEQFIEQFGQETTDSLLETMNCPPILMGRVRAGDPKTFGLPVVEEPFPVVQLENPHVGPEIYVQNVTSATLLGRACAKLKPKRILDLCAAPGGKALALHDLFPEATLVANDRNESKAALLRENFERYGVEAEVTVNIGQADPFDLIVVDAPCSNSGVLHKRAEARWRIDQNQVDDLVKQQEALIGKAFELLAPGGVLCYMTCSILSQENRSPGGKVLYEETILPNEAGFDGGYAIAVERG